MEKPFPFVVHLDEVPETEDAYPAPFDAEKLSLARDLASAAGSKTLGVQYQRLLPGRRSSFTHAHSAEEEFVFVLSGGCALRWIAPGAAPREAPLRAGHAVGFPAGTGIAHTFVNRGSAECALLVIGERRPEDRVFYPEDLSYQAHFAARRPEHFWRDPPQSAGGATARSGAAADALPPFAAHIDELPEHEGAYVAPFDAEKLSLYRALGRATGTVRVGYGYERLLPGRRTSFTHAHAEEEEFIYVIAGSCAVRAIAPGAPPREQPLRAGHAVSFPAGTGIAHTLVNRGREEAVLLVIGERRPTDRYFYPEDPEYQTHFAAREPHRVWKRG